MTSVRGRAPRRVDGRALVAAWLYGVAVLVAAMIALGGLTRLTGSGLSIVRWDLVVGILPPLTEAAWESAFARYRRIPQFAAENAWMELADFRVIFWWEWAHRLLGRLVGLAYAIPLAVFAIRGALPTGWGGRLVLLLALGAAQGAVGWWMVRSGLVDRTDVSPYRLAVHLGLAFVILGLLLDAAVRIHNSGSASVREERALHLRVSVFPRVGVRSDPRGSLRRRNGSRTGLYGLAADERQRDSARGAGSSTALAELLRESRTRPIPAPGARIPAAGGRHLARMGRPRLIGIGAPVVGGGLGGDDWSGGAGYCNDMGRRSDALGGRASVGRCGAVRDRRRYAHRRSDRL